jgi:uncharacterized RDD family membrane protein YckC
MAKRIAAKLLDAAFIFLLTGLAIAPAFLLSRPFHSADQASIGISFLYLGWLLFIPAIIVVVPVAYETVFVALRGATPGKRCCGLRIVSSSGDPLRWKRSLARTAAQVVSATMGAVGYLMAFLDAEQKTLHDRICGTLVIAESSDLKNGPATTADNPSEATCPMCGASAGSSENCRSCGERIDAPSGR